MKGKEWCLMAQEVIKIVTDSTIIEEQDLKLVENTDTKISITATVLILS